MNMKERRRAQRVDANLAITVSGGPAEARGKTLNISSNGVYFQSPYFIEPLTKVQLELMIPDQDGKGGEGTSVTCEGIVVRIEPEREDAAVSEYHVAIFFTFLSESSQKALSRYLKRRLAS